MNRRNRISKIEQAVQPVPDGYCFYVNWTQPGETEPPAEDVQVHVFSGGRMERMSLAEYRERFPETELVRFNVAFEDE